MPRRTTDKIDLYYACEVDKAGILGLGYRSKAVYSEAAIRAIFAIPDDMRLLRVETGHFDYVAIRIDGSMAFFHNFRLIRI